MKLGIRVLFMLVSTLFAGVSYAGYCTANFCHAKVALLYPHQNGNIYIKADADMSVLGCTLDQGKFIVLERSNVSHAEIYSMLLAASISEKYVSIRIANGSSNCSLVYSQIGL